MKKVTIKRKKIFTYSNTIVSSTLLIQQPIMKLQQAISKLQQAVI